MIFSSSLTSAALITKNESTIQTSAKIIKVDPYHFDFIRQSDDLIPASDTTTLAFDAKLRQVCNHYVDGIQYTRSSCIRCLGTDTYYDLKYSDVGEVITVSNEEKLAQLLEKVVLTDLNPFHPLYAVNVRQFLGAIPISTAKTVVYNSLVSAIGKIKEDQQGTENLSSAAKIATIDSISVTENVDSLAYTVVLTTVSGAQFKLSGIFDY